MQCKQVPVEQKWQIRLNPTIEMSSFLKFSDVPEICGANTQYTKGCMWDVDNTYWVFPGDDIAALLSTARKAQNFWELCKNAHVEFSGNHRR